jgi:hypothetical protein
MKKEDLTMEIDHIITSLNYVKEQQKLKLYYHRLDRSYYLSTDNTKYHEHGTENVYFRKGCLELVDLYPTWYKDLTVALLEANKMGYLVEEGGKNEEKVLINPI